MTNSPIESAAIAQIFESARTFRHWRQKPVADETLRQIYALLRMAPTASNLGPGRFLFIRSPEAKAQLLPCVSEGNIPSVTQAPVTVVIAHDLRFYENIPKLAAWANPDVFVNDASLVEETAFRNSSLQGGYLMIAARALGLDCGPMSGFNQTAVDQQFFSGSSWKSNFLCTLGYGDTAQLYPRGARLDFDEACRLL